MGTSVSKPSPNTSNWKRVFICYENNNISENRVVNEVWRASENESRPISDMLKSNAIYSCYEAVNTSSNFQDALQKFNRSIIEHKGNSIIAEFAKRAIPVAFQSNSPSEQWKKSFFSEVTSYIVSRDVSGYVGGDSRNKSINDLITFKKNISERVSKVLETEKKNIKSYKDWTNYVDNSITKLKSTK